MKEPQTHKAPGPQGPITMDSQRPPQGSGPPDQDPLGPPHPGFPANLTRWSKRSTGLPAPPNLQRSVTVFCQAQNSLMEAHRVIRKVSALSFPPLETLWPDLEPRDALGGGGAEGVVCEPFHVRCRLLSGRGSATASP